MKTPIRYYGGKLRMVGQLLPLIPGHDLYTEACAGGLALFFAKTPAMIEVINDLNGEVINFYEVLCVDYLNLNYLVQKTLHSREAYNDAKVIYEHPHLFEPVRRAWAFWVLCNQGFAGRIGSWGYDKSKTSLTKSLVNRKINFSPALRNRLENTQIESRQHHTTVVKSRDRVGAFHYLDPPYPGTNQGHYTGYTFEDFERDLQVLSTLEGKFLLSNFQSEILTEYTREYGWYTKTFKTVSSAANTKRKPKIEVLTANYDIQKLAANV